MTFEAHEATIIHGIYTFFNVDDIRCFTSMFACIGDGTNFLKHDVVVGREEVFPPIF